jgi:mediator of RNA polymerase II transcription subunit 22
MHAHIWRSVAKEKFPRFLDQMTDFPQTDYSRPSALPTARLHKRRLDTASLEQNSAEYLDNVEEDWNKKVDQEVDTLVEGMVDLVSLASVSSFRTRCFMLIGFKSAGLHRLVTKTSFGSHRKLSRLSRVQSPWYVDLTTSQRLVVLSGLQIRAANSLLSITHSMKLLLLLSDEAQIAHRRDEELSILQKEKDDTKRQVIKILDELLKHQRTNVVAPTAQPEPNGA